MLEQKRISVIGGGQMCEAIFSGAVASGVVRPEMVTITDLNEERLVDLATRYGFATLPNDPQNEGAKEAARQGTFWYSRSSRSLHAQCLRRCGMSFVLTS